MNQSNPYLPPEASLVGERIEDEEELATLGRRFGASMFDGIILGVLIWSAIYAMGQFDVFKAGNAPFQVMLVIVAGGVLLYMLVHGYFLKRDGQTIGKKVLGIKVTRLNGEHPGFVRLVFIRYLPVALLAFVPLLGPLLSLVDSLLIFRSDRRCAHDLIAGTKVVKVRKAA